MEHRIRVSAPTESLDGRLSRLAAAKHGVISRSEAIREGATRGFIQRRLDALRWERLYPGVYRLAGSPESGRQQLLAACLATGDRAVASHRAVASLWQLPGCPEGPVEISTPTSGRLRVPGIIVHRVKDLVTADITVVDAIPATNPTRTLIDLAAVVEADLVEEALDDALRRGLTSIPRLKWRLSKLGRRGRPGIAVVRALVEARAEIRTAPQSVLETRLLRLLRRARLPMPVCQYPVRDRGRLIAVVDFAYPDERIAIEADGYRWHSGRARWQRDLARRNALTARGWRLIHVTWTDLDQHPDAVIDMVAEALGER